MSRFPGSAVAVGAAAQASPGALRRVVADVLELVKARLTAMVLITATAGYLLAAGNRADVGQLLLTLLGIALVASSAQALNQMMEADVDALMDRTRDRPIPAGRMSRAAAAMIGAATGVAGLAILAMGVGPVPFLLAALTHGLYLVAYTPLKRRSAWCVWVGAIPGAIPPVIGWSAAGEILSPEAAILFGLLFLWQIPHFIAIAWLYRDDYRRAGLVMLRPGDDAGRVAGAESLVFSALLALLAVSPAWFLDLPAWYGAMAALPGGWFFWRAAGFLAGRSRDNARKLFLASILFLPASLVLLLCAGL